MILCSHCGLGIACTAEDPVLHTCVGTFHHKCMTERFRELREKAHEKKQASAAKRSALMKARWQERKTRSDEEGKVEEGDVEAGDSNG